MPVIGLNLKLGVAAYLSFPVHAAGFNGCVARSIYLTVLYP